MTAKIDFKPEVALVLGSGLGDYADEIQIVDTISYNDIKDFPVSTVNGHKGRFVFGYVGEVPVVIMQGRKWGGDAIGMSTACEAMAARHQEYPLRGRGAGESDDHRLSGNFPCHRHAHIPL